MACAFIRHAYAGELHDELGSYALRQRRLELYVVTPPQGYHYTNGTVWERRSCHGCSDCVDVRAARQASSASCNPEPRVQ